jgi:hypothetical protein
MAHTARTVKPGLSHDARDKLLAALNWPIGKWKQSAEYAKAPFYFDACLEWCQRLSDVDRETLLTVADVMSSAHKGAAESIAASLPPGRGARCDPRP